MSRQRRSVPFSVTLLTLMGLIIVPLAAALLLLGWRAVDQLEQRNVAHRMSALDNAMEGFLLSGLRVVVAVGTTLAGTPEFAVDHGVELPDAKLRQLALVTGRYPAIAAAFVGYGDGDFLYAGEIDFMTAEQRREFDVPDGAAFLLRTVTGDGAARRETWWFELADGRWTPPRKRSTDYDPRQRPWLIDALRQKSPALTEPYTFAFTEQIGVSAGIPLPSDGAVGFDFTIDTLSRLMGQYRITPNSIIMVASGSGKVFMESEACQVDRTECLSGEDAVRAAMRAAIAEVGSDGQRVERDMPLAGRAYRLLVHAMPATFGQRFLVAAAVPMIELTADSQALVRRATVAAAVAVTLAVIGTLLASLLLSRSISRIALKTESIRSLDFSDRTPIDSRITEIVRLSDSIERMREGLEVFGRYVSKNLVHQIMRSPETAGVGGTRREITVMFSDIEGFSLLSENMEPELLTSRLSRYFDALGSAIIANRGTIDKYIGDSIMAFWNAPETDPDHVVNACRAALQAAAASRALSGEMARARPAGLPHPFRPPHRAGRGRQRRRARAHQLHAGRRRRQHGVATGGAEQGLRHRGAGQRRGGRTRRGALRVASHRPHRRRRHHRGARNLRADGRTRHAGRGCRLPREVERGGRGLSRRTVRRRPRGLPRRCGPAAGRRALLSLRRAMRGLPARRHAGRLDRRLALRPEVTSPVVALGSLPIGSPAQP